MKEDALFWGRLSPVLVRPRERISRGQRENSPNVCRPHLSRWPIRRRRSSWTERATIRPAANPQPVKRPVKPRGCNLQLTWKRERQKIVERSWHCGRLPWRYGRRRLLNETDGCVHRDGQNWPFRWTCRGTLFLPVLNHGRRNRSTNANQFDPRRFVRPTSFGPVIMQQSTVYGHVQPHANVTNQKSIGIRR